MESHSVPSSLEATTSRASESTEWCTICYYELKERVGDVFRVSEPSVTIDGFTHANDPRRICLGLLSNVNRTLVAKKTRHYIGNGVRIYRVGSDVFLECLSDCAVFIQSGTLNRYLGWHLPTVSKVSSGETAGIFNSDQFREELEGAIPKGFEAVYDVRKMCTIRASFVKGWGPEYRRKAITDTPCWIEINLSSPLRCLDGVLREIHPFKARLISSN